MIEDLYNSQGKMTARFASIGDMTPEAQAIQDDRMAQIAAWNRQSMMGGQNAPDPRAMAAQSLLAQYQPRTPSFARWGNDVMIDGQVRPLSEGEDAGKLQEAQRAAAQKSYLDRIKGNLAAGTKERKLLADPRFQQLGEEEQRAIYQRVYGTTLDEDLMADSMGDGTTTADVRAMMAVPERQKQSKEWLAGFKANYGVEPGVAFGKLSEQTLEGQTFKTGYDPATGTAYLPGRYVKDDNGGTMYIPAGQVSIPAPMYQQYQRQQAYMSGLPTVNRMLQADPMFAKRQRLAELEAKEAAAREAEVNMNSPENAMRRMREIQQAAAMRGYIQNVR